MLKVSLVKGHLVGIALTLPRPAIDNKHIGNLLELDIQCQSFSLHKMESTTLDQVSIPVIAFIPQQSGYQLLLWWHQYSLLLLRCVGSGSHHTWLRLLSWVLQTWRVASVRRLGWEAAVLVCTRHAGLLQLGPHGATNRSEFLVAKTTNTLVHLELL